MNKLGRPKGAKGKPQFVGVKLQELCSLLLPNTLIPVHKDFAKALTLCGNGKIEIKELPNDFKISTDKIEFTVNNT